MPPESSEPVSCCASPGWSGGPGRAGLWEVSRWLAARMTGCVETVCAAPKNLVGGYLLPLLATACARMSLGCR